MKWIIIDIYHGCNKDYSKLNDGVLEFLLLNKNIAGLFYDYYGGGTEGDCIKIGFLENKVFYNKLYKQLDIFNKKGWFLNIKETTRNYPTIKTKELNVDYIKSYSMVLALQLRKLINDKNEYRVMLETFHHICNQLGFGYKKETEIYKKIYERWFGVVYKDGDKKEKRKFKR